MYDVIAIGSASQDVLMSADAFRVIADDVSRTGQSICLPFGSKIQVQKIVFASGGGGTNAAVTFARQGYTTACIGVVGRDASGSTILNDLRREGVDAKYIQFHDDDITAYSVILVGLNGERTILSYKGEGIHWKVDQIPFDRLQAKWAYVNSLGGHEDVLSAIVRWAQKNKTHLAINPGAQELALGLPRLSDYLKSFDIVGMNQEEAAMLTGISFEREEEIFRTLDAAIGGIFIMTKGVEGVTVSDGHHIYSAGIPSPEVVERTGAGDAFHSAFTSEFIRGGSIEKAIQHGAANATSVVIHYGAQKGILKKGSLGPWPPVSVTRRAL